MTKFLLLGPSVACAAAVTASMQSGWNTVAGEWKSSVMETVSGRPGVQPSLRVPISSPAAIWGKSRVTAWTIVAKVSSLVARRSSENETLPGTVLTLPGLRFRIPVLANPPWVVASLCACSMSLLAVSRASALLLRSVVPVCVSRPVTSTVIHLYACTPLTTPIFLLAISNSGPCSMCSSKCAAMGVLVYELGVLPRYPMRESSVAMVAVPGCTSRRLYAASRGIEPAHTPDAHMDIGKRAPSSLFFVLVLVSLCFSKFS